MRQASTVCGSSNVQETRIVTMNCDALLPLPKGEGWGEGEGSSTNPPFTKDPPRLLLVTVLVARAIRNLKKENVGSLSRAFKDDAAIGLNDVNGPRVEVEQTDVQATGMLTPLLFDEIAQFNSFDAGKFVLGATRIAAATWDERQEAGALDAVVEAKSNNPGDDVESPGDNGRLHRHGDPRGEKTIDGSSCFTESRTPNDFVMVGLITMQTYFNLSSGRAEVRNKDVGQSNPIGREPGLPAPGTHIVDQFRESVVNRWLSAAEVNGFYAASQEPINSCCEC
jgi:hypothetical protein